MEIYNENKLIDLVEFQHSDLGHSDIYNNNKMNKDKLILDKIRQTSVKIKDDLLLLSNKKSIDDENRNDSPTKFELDEELINSVVQEQ